MQHLNFGQVFQRKTCSKLDRFSRLLDDTRTCSWGLKWTPFPAEQLLQKTFGREINEKRRRSDLRSGVDEKSVRRSRLTRMIEKKTNSRSRAFSLARIAKNDDTLPLATPPNPNPPPTPANHPPAPLGGRQRQLVLLLCESIERNALEGEFSFF